MTDEQRLPAEVAAPAGAEERRPRRSKKAGAPDVAVPPGYRSSRRSSKAAKKARSLEQRNRLMEAFSALTGKVGRGAATALTGILGVALLVGLVLALIFGLNGATRWYLQRKAAGMAAQAAKQKQRENLLVIAVDNKQATAFVAMRLDRKQSHVWGIAIPAGAFVEVPGQGYERIGDSYKAGASVSVAAVANYLSIPIDYYMIMGDAAYKDMMKRQGVDAVMGSVQATNLDPDVKPEVTSFLAKVPTKNVGIIPLPVRSVSIGGQTFFEPQRDQIADLLFSWWGVRFGSSRQSLRLIVYNGAGVPGIAGVAAQQLIKGGYEVVQTGNAQRFDYAKTQIVLLRADPGVAVGLRDILGTGDVVSSPVEQNIADAIVIIGKDYRPSSK